MSKPRIVVPDDYPPVMGPSNAFKMLKFRADVGYHDTLPPTPEVLLERIGDAEHVVSIRSSVPYPAEVLEALAGEMRYCLNWACES